MKNLILTVLLVLCTLNVNANDTIRVESNKIEKVIVHSTKNTKGKEVTKYYFIYNGELINTNKTVVEKYKLCKQYGARIALAMIKTKNNKRIILN